MKFLERATRDELFLEQRSRRDHIFGATGGGQHDRAQLKDHLQEIGRPLAGERGERLAYLVGVANGAAKRLVHIAHEEAGLDSHVLPHRGHGLAE